MNIFNNILINCFFHSDFVSHLVDIEMGMGGWVAGLTGNNTKPAWADLGNIFKVTASGLLAKQPHLVCQFVHINGMAPNNT